MSESKRTSSRHLVCAGIAGYLRAASRQLQVVVATVHEDILPWLLPDLVLQSGTATRRPAAFSESGGLTAVKGGVLRTTSCRTSVSCASRRSISADCARSSVLVRNFSSRCESKLVRAANTLQSNSKNTNSNFFQFFSSLPLLPHCRHRCLRAQKAGTPPKPLYNTQATFVHYLDVCPVLW